MIIRLRNVREDLHAVLLLELEVLLPEGVDSVNHDLDQLDLRVSKTMLVGDVISVASLTTRFTTGSTGLDSKFLTSGLELVNALLGVAGQVNVDGGSHASAQVGGAGVDVAVLLRQGVFLARLGLDGLLDSLDTAGKTGEDSLDVSSLLHGDDPGLVLLIDPQKEGLGVVVEDSTTLGPVTLHTSNSEVSVSRHEEEVIINQLLTNSFVHASERIVLASQVSGQLGQSVGHQLLHVHSLLLGDAGGQTESINVATNSDSGGVNWHSGLNVANNLLRVHVRLVLGVSGDAVVLLDDGVEDLREVLVGVPVSSIDTAVLVVELNGAGTSLGDGEATGLGLDVLDFVPSLLGDVLGDQGVGRLDSGEVSRHCLNVVDCVEYCC